MSGSGASRLDKVREHRCQEMTRELRNVFFEISEEEEEERRRRKKEEKEEEEKKFREKGEEEGGINWG